MKRRIVIATGIFPPQMGGPATYSKLLADKLPLNGFLVHVVNFGEVILLPKVLRHAVYFFKVLLAGMSADIIYAQDPVSVGLPAMLVAKILRKKLYLKIVGDYAWEQGIQRYGVTDLLDNFSCACTKYSLPVRFLKRVQLFVAKRAYKIITPSNYLKKIITNWGVSEDMIEVIYNGFTPPTFSEKKETIREDLNIRGYTVLSIGRLVPWKGFEGLIETIPSLRLEIPDVHLYIAGEGPDKELLKKKITEMELENHVTLLGKLPQDKLFEYIRASDVFVLNTSYEGFSHQLLEVSALETPIVTTSVGGNIEIIEDHKNGILVTYNDRPAIGKAIIELYQNRSLARLLAVSAQETAKEFSNERMIDATVSALLMS